MKRLIRLGAVALLLAGSAAPVLAQANASPAETTMDLSLSADAAAQVIAAMAAEKNADLTTITETSTINLVLVSDLKANGGADALTALMAKIGDSAAAFKANVETNAALQKKVTDAGYTTELVVAVLANDDGSFTAIINDEHP